MKTQESYPVSERRKEVWAVELEIMDEIDRICNKYGIKYFLAGGSMIGAARHNGFIPWDDDIDVGMLRPDYEKFLKVCESELPSTCFLQSRDSDNGYFYAHAKLRRSDTTAIRKKDYNSGLTFNQGIFVDLVPFDSIPGHLLPRIIHYIRLDLTGKIYKRHFYFKGFEHRTWKNHIVQILGKLVFCFTTPEKLAASYEKLLRQYANKKTKYIGEITTDYKYKKSRRERTLYDELIDHQFEDRVYKIPKRYEEILNLAYGDWRTPKPQAPTLHGTTFFDPNHPYTYYLEGKGNVDFDIPL